MVLRTSCPAPPEIRDQLAQPNLKNGCSVMAISPIGRRPVLFLIGFAGAVEDSSTVAFLSVKFFGASIEAADSTRVLIVGALGAGSRTGEGMHRWRRCGVDITLETLVIGKISGFNVKAFRDAATVGDQRCTR